MIEYWRSRFYTLKASDFYMDSFGQLVELIEFMRGPKGCPWDRQQKISDFKRYLAEESEEAISAIEAQDYENLKEEIGDLLWHVVFISQIGKERGLFTIEDVIMGLKDKIIRRHPHVFGDSPRLESAKEVEAIWESIKAKER